jgi:hypothetical protein
MQGAASKRHAATACARCSLSPYQLAPAGGETDAVAGAELQPTHGSDTFNTWNYNMQNTKARRAQQLHVMQQDHHVRMQ